MRASEVLTRWTDPRPRSPRATAIGSHDDFGSRHLYFIFHMPWTKYLDGNRGRFNTNSRGEPLNRRSWCASTWDSLPAAVRSCFDSIRGMNARLLITSDHYSQVQRQRGPGARRALVGRNLRDSHNVIMKRGSCVVNGREEARCDEQAAGGEEGGSWASWHLFSYMQDSLARTAAP